MIASKHQPLHRPQHGSPAWPIHHQLLARQRSTVCTVLLNRSSFWLTRCNAVSTDVVESNVEQPVEPPKRLEDIWIEQAVSWPGHEGSRLIIRPITRDKHLETSHVLADSFVEVKNIEAYRGSFRRTFLQRRILVYLNNQVDLFPETVVLVALMQKPSNNNSSDGVDHNQAAAGRLTDSEKATWASITAQDRTMTSLSNSSTPVEGVAADVSDDASSISSSISNLTTVNVDEALSSSMEEAIAQWQSERALQAVDSSAAASQSQPVGTSQSQSEEVVVGTVEVSFNRSTHSTYLTLNPPKKCAYLCNMAVSKEWRRKGIGQSLIKAVDEACRIAGEHEIYLHLRVQDAPAAALYNSVGFEQMKADGWWVKLFGQDQRRLMRKTVQ